MYYVQSKKYLYNYFNFFYLFNKVQYNLIRVQYSKGGFNRDANNKNSYNSIFSF